MPDVLICRRGKAGAEGGRGRKVKKARISLVEGSEVKKNGTSGDDESVYYHADQYVDRVCGLDRSEYHDSFDPSR